MLYVAGCEEHEEPGPHPIFEGKKTTWCPGVRQANIDYEAAAEEMYAQLQDIGLGSRYAGLAKAIVDAALPSSVVRIEGET